MRQGGERRVVAQETSGSDGIAADHNRFRVRFAGQEASGITLKSVGDLQQTGLKGSEGMSEDVRAFLVPLL